MINRQLKVSLLAAALVALTIALTRVQAIDSRASALISYPRQGGYAAPQAGAGFGPQFDRNYSPAIRIALKRNRTIAFNNYRLVEPDISYYGVVGIGSPPQLLNVVFDTNWDGIWLPYYTWNPFANNVHYREGYRCGDSPTCSPSKRQVSVEYRNTKLEGEIYEDFFTIYEGLHKEDAEIAITRNFKFYQNFLAVEDAGDEQFRFKPYDGVIGLRPVAQSELGTHNFLLSYLEGFQRQQFEGQANEQNDSQSSGASSMLVDNNNLGYYRQQGSFLNQQQQQRLPYPIFSFWFSANLNSREAGELMIGGLDENRFVGNIQYHPIISYTEWRLSLSQVYMNSGTLSCPNGCSVVLDTAANSIVGPESDVGEIRNMLQAQHEAESGLWLLDCEKLNRGGYPQITFVIGDTPYIILPENYVRVLKYKENPVCYLGIKHWFKPDWLFGINFIGAYYTVFDFHNRVVGFARAVY